MLDRRQLLLHHALLHSAVPLEPSLRAGRRLVQGDGVPLEREWGIEGSRLERTEQRQLMLLSRLFLPDYDLYQRSQETFALAATMFLVETRQVETDKQVLEILDRWGEDVGPTLLSKVIDRAHTHGLHHALPQRVLLL